MTYTLNRLTHCTDMGPADWIAPRLAEWASGLTSIVPSGFPAYARIFHRPGGREPDGARVPGQTTWTEVTESTGRIAHPLMQWHAISRGTAGRPDWPGELPDEGELDGPQLELLTRLLRAHTSTADDCFHAYWNGFGGWVGGPTMYFLKTSRRRWPWRSRKRLPPILRGEPVATRRPEPFLPFEVTEGPLLRLPNREYFLFSGPIEAAADFAMEVFADSDTLDPHTPQLLWPADRAWCVATEIDVDSTLVGGTQDLIDAVIAHEGLEALPVPPDGDVTYLGDRVNDPDGSSAQAWRG